MTAAGSRRARAGLALRAAAACAALPACTTNLGDGGVGDYDKSTLIALSDPVVAMTIAGSSVYWMDDSGSVWSCAKVDCNNAPKRLYTGAALVDGAVQMGASGDWLFWVINESLFGCPTSGCASGTLAPLASASGPTGSAPAFAIDTAGGTGAYWFGQPTSSSGTQVLRYAPDCDAGCPETVFQGPNLGGDGGGTVFQCDTSDTSCTPCSSDGDCPAGQFCTDSPGGPSPAACSPQLGPGDACSLAFASPNVCAFGTCNGTCPSIQPQSSNGLVVAGGQLFFVSASFPPAIVTCPVTGCALSTLTTYWAPSTSQQQPILLAGSPDALYFSQSEGGNLESCSVPTCTSPATVASQVGSFLGLSPDDFYVSGHDTSFATACPLAGCPSGSPTVTPDPSLDSTPLGLYPTGRPFAVDGSAAIEWATSSIFGQPGSQIVRTPAP